VGAKTAAALAKHCTGQLRTLNLSYTSVLPIAVAPIVSSSDELEVLKLAGINNWVQLFSLSTFLLNAALILRIYRLTQTSPNF